MLNGSIHPIRLVGICSICSSRGNIQSSGNIHHIFSNAVNQIQLHRTVPSDFSDVASMDRTPSSLVLGTWILFPENRLFTGVRRSKVFPVVWQNLTAATAVPAVIYKHR